jgi:hypothetical protein
MFGDAFMWLDLRARGAAVAMRVKGERRRANDKEKQWLGLGVRRWNMLHIEMIKEVLRARQAQIDLSQISPMMHKKGPRLHSI